MRALPLLLLSHTGCADDRLCENGDVLCMDILDATVDVDPKGTPYLDIVAEIRGDFVVGGKIINRGASLVKPDVNGLLIRFPLDLRFRKGDERWHPDKLIHLRTTADSINVDSIYAVCSQSAIVELNLAAPWHTNPDDYPTGSTMWFRDFEPPCP